MENLMQKKCTLITALLPVIATLLWACFSVPLHAQSVENKATEVMLTEQNKIIRQEDINAARSKAEEVRNNADKSRKEIESLISHLEGDAETTKAFLDKLLQEKKDIQSEVVSSPEQENPKYLSLLDMEIMAVKQKTEVDGEQIQECKDTLTALQAQVRAYTDWLDLFDSIIKLNDTIALTSPDKAVAMRKEADIAKGFIAAQQAILNEKESLVSFFTNELEDVKVRTSDKVKDVAKDIESLKAEIKDETLAAMAQEKAGSILLWYKVVQEQWVAIFKTKLEAAKIRHDVAAMALKNAELNAAYLAEKANRLEVQLKDEELKKKQAELEAAKRVEAVTQKAAEATRVASEKTLQEVAKKGEEVIQLQKITTSPEKRRVLELEAETHKLVGYVAKKNDELITESAQRFKDVTESKQLEADFDLLFSKAETIKDLDEIQSKAEAELKRLADAPAVIDSLINLLKQEERLTSDNLEAAYKEIPMIKKQVASFEDKELASLAIDYAQQKANLLDERLGLTMSRLDRLRERLEIKKNVLDLLRKQKEKIIEAKAANVWIRRKSSISAETFKSIYKDLAGCYGQFDQLYGWGQTQGKNVVVYVSNKKATIGFWAKLVALSVLIAVYYFSQQYIQRFCEKKALHLYEIEGGSYYRTRLLPSLFIVLQKSINSIWLAILSLVIPVIFNVETPWVSAATCVFVIVAVYKMLKGLIIESFGLEKGDKKLFTSLAYISPKHLYRSLNVILNYSLIFLSTITVLTVFGYKNDVIELLWFIYRVGTVILLLWIATQKTLIFNLLPGVESQLGRFIHRVIKILYPLFIVFVVSLFAIRSLGYPVLTYSLLKTCIKSFVIAFIAFWIWKYLHHRLSNARETSFRKIAVKKNAQEEKSYRSITAMYQVVFNYAVSIITAVIIIRVWVKTFRYAIGSPAAPFLVGQVFGQAGAIIIAIGNGLRYRFDFEGGRYTTPIKIIFALIVVVASFFIARYVKKLLEDRLFQKLRIERGLSQTFSTLSRYVVIGIAVLIGFRMAGVPLTSLAFFAGAFGIGIGFGMQNIISNFVSGIILLFERPMRVGDVITLEDGTLGSIEKISARSTTISTPDEVTITVPNSKFIESRITNWTHPRTRMRGSVKVGVSYDSDPELVKECLLEVVKQNPNVRTYPEPFVRFAEFGDSALLFELYFWADNPGKRWFTQSELNFAIAKAFRNKKIEIAFPQRDIHIRSVVPFPIHGLPDQAEQQGNQGKNV